MKKIIFLIACFFVLLSCKTKKNDATTAPIDLRSIDTKEGIKDSKSFFRQINKKNKFKRLKINSTIKINTDAFIPTINGIFYIENNKKIWINFSSFLINIGRGLAEKKEFKGYLKQPEKMAIEGDYQQLNTMTGLDFLEYSSLEKLLIGSTFIPIKKEDYILIKNKEGYTLTSLIPISFKTNENEKYNISLDYTEDFTLTNVQIVNTSKTQLIQINYSNRTAFEKLKLPQNVKIIIKGTKNSEILIENTKFEDSEMKTPFRIPKNYTKVQLHD